MVGTSNQSVPEIAIDYSAISQACWLCWSEPWKADLRTSVRIRFYEPSMGDLWGKQARLSSNAQVVSRCRCEKRWELFESHPGRGQPEVEALTLDSRSWVISCLKESMENG